jgi:hypothetical protein
MSRVKFLDAMNIEPDAKEIGWATEGCHEHVALSQAISLKRIADALERMQEPRPDRTEPVGVDPIERQTAKAIGMPVENERENIAGPAATLPDSLTFGGDVIAKLALADGARIAWADARNTKRALITRSRYRSALIALHNAMSPGKT